MAITKKFEIGKEYRCLGLFGGEYVIKVVGRTENTVSFIYNEETSDDRTIHTEDIKIQKCAVYDNKRDEVSVVDSEIIIAREYHSRVV